MLGPHVSLCVHASEDIPSSFTMVRKFTLQGKETIIIFIIMLRTSLFIAGVRHQQLSNNAHLTRKGPKRCVN